MPENAEANGTSPLDAAIGAEAVARYERALGRLRDEEREAIVLRVEFGYDFDTIAAQLGKPSAAAARMAVTRAIAKLAEEMRDAR
jgi:RNA polymerase sigma-70 factor (ECF subfamily)